MNRRTANKGRAARPRVVVVQELLPHYRVPLFTALDQRLEQQGHDFHLIFGSATTDDTRRLAEHGLRSSAECPVRTYRLGATRVVRQPTRGGLRHADLVIVEQGSRLVLNYRLMVHRRIGGPMLGLWGHGLNRGASRTSPLGERMKRLLIRQCDWWFAYTDGVADYVESMGMPRDRITSVGNATDTVALTTALANQTDTDRAGTRARFSLGEGPVVLMLGSLYTERRLEVLFEVADVLQTVRPDAVIAIAGDGPMADHVAGWAAVRSNVRALGVLQGPELAALGAVASVSLNVGVVGLAILDSFALGLPMIAGELIGHGPEIDYLEHDVNGIMLGQGAGPADYAREVAGLLADRERRQRFSAAARVVAAGVTIAEMADRFSAGIEAALESRRS